MTVNDILDAVLESDSEHNDGEIEIFLELPDGDQSDGYSGSEDEGDKDASKLPARVLLAPAQLGRGPSDEDIAIEDVDSDNNDGGGDSEIGKRKRTGRSRTPLRSRKLSRKWKTTIESVPPQPIGIFPPPNYGEAVGKTANELFQLFWKDGLLDVICQESNEYQR